MKKDPILLLHGALGSKSQFLALQNMLSPLLEVYSFDFLGHGGDSSNSPFTIQVFTKQLFDFLNKNAIEKTHIFGYSMGGYVALNFAHRYPAMAGRIMTLGTKFDWNPATVEKETKMLNPELMETKVPAFTRHLNTLHTGNSWKIVVQNTAKMMIELGNNPILNEEVLCTIHNDVLIGIGAMDHMVSIEESMQAKAALPNGQIVQLPECKHPIEKVDQNLLSTQIINFITN